MNALAFGMIMALLWPGLLCADTKEKSIEEVKGIYLDAQAAIKKDPDRQFYQTWTDSHPSDWISGTPPKNILVTNVIKIWTLPSDSSVIVLSTNTPSGDWYTENQYYFYAEGNIAFIYSVYKTLTTMTSVERRYYFAKDGEPIRYLLRITDMNTNKEVSFSEANFPDYPPILYLNIMRLLEQNKVPRK